MNYYSLKKKLLNIKIVKELILLLIQLMRIRVNGIFQVNDKETQVLKERNVLCFIVSYMIFAELLLAHKNRFKLFFGNIVPPITKNLLINRIEKTFGHVVEYCKDPISVCN